MEQKPKTSSVIWKINRSIQWKRLKTYILWDILFGIGAILSACAAAESRYGALELARERSATWKGYLPFWQRLESWQYVCKIGNQDVTVEIGQMAVVACTVIGVVFCIQFLSWLIDWSSQNHRLREYMRPIDELAMTAEKLSVQGIDEERIQNLEEAIDQLSASENNISTGDSDLKGIENAINNLLKRLQASYREQTRFVDDASHELRTPIAVIQGYASMLERWGMNDRATLEEAVHAISEESAHMKELVDQLLFLARGDGGRQQFHPEPIQAEELMKEICEESEMIDHRHQYILVQKWDGYIQADVAMIKQAIRILVDNAAKYTPEGGKITLRLELCEDGRAGLGVQDEGIGLKAEEAAHMFERFFRGDAVRGTTQGSGLGLSIAKWIADRHHAVIDVVSFKGVGSRITVKLPIYSQDTTQKRYDKDNRDRV